MVARAQEVPSFTHLILPAQEEDYGLPQGAVYYDLSQSCCPRPVYVREGGGQTEMPLEVGHVDSTRDHPNKKRKIQSCNEGSDDDTGDTGDDNKSVKKDDHKKQNHSEIEKRRRDKMNTYITELSAMVPMCHALSRKLDKLTVLRMAVQHMKAIRGAVASYTDGNYKPAFLSDLQLKQIIKQAAEGFLFVVGCDRGRILFVSESVSQALNYSQSDLLGQSWFDILHPKDVAKVKEQLSSSHLSPRERYIDAKTMLPVKAEVPQGGARLSPGSRRSFFCRMKCRSVTTTVKEEADTTTGFHKRTKPQAQQTVSDKKYRVIQCTGYLKPWGSGKLREEEEEKEAEGEGESAGLSCLVAMGRVVLIPFPQPRPPNRPYHSSINVRPLQFISRHAMDGKFLFVDQRATLVLGFLPQELLGTSMYEYYYKEDICHLAESHKAALQSKEPVSTKESFNLRENIVFYYRGTAEGCECVHTKQAPPNHYTSSLRANSSPRVITKEESFHILDPETRKGYSTLTDMCSANRFRSKEGNYVQLQSEWKSFRNPWTKEGEYLVAKNSRLANSVESLVESSVEKLESSSSQTSGNSEYFSSNQNGGSEIPKIISSNVEASNIGRQIAEEVLERKASDSPSSTINGSTPSPTNHQPALLEVGSKYPSLAPGENPTSNLRVISDISDSDEEVVRVWVTINSLDKANPGTQAKSLDQGSSNSSSPTQNSLSSREDGEPQVPRQPDNQLHSGISPERLSVSSENNGSLGLSKSSSDDNYSSIRNNVTLSSLTSETGAEGDEMMEMIGSAVSPADAAPTDGNDEAAMAVIMSLLEADAGLGGPVDFTGLPWPLP